VSAIYRQSPLRLNIESDADVIAYLESRENKNDTIRQALKAKMDKEAEDEDIGCEPPGVAEAADAVFDACKHGKATFDEIAEGKQGGRRWRNIG